MAVLFEKTKLLTDKQFHYCPGCNHGIIHRLVAEVIDEMNLDGKVIGVAPVGCSVFAYDYFNCDMYEAAHGRAPAVATGVKRAVGPDTMVFTYQGDGDLASIGTAEIVHAAHRAAYRVQLSRAHRLFAKVYRLELNRALLKIALGLLHVEVLFKGVYLYVHVCPPMLILLIIPCLRRV